MTLLIISFFAGILTVLAPCVLPLLPVIVGGSLTGEKIHRKKAFVVALSLGISVIVFTLLLKVSAAFINIPQGLWMWISGGIIIIFGITTLFPKILDHISGMAKLNQASNKLMTDGLKKNSIWGDIIIGASLGPVFSTCSPTYFIVLATVLPESFFKGMVYLLAYTIGLCISLLIVSFVGQRIVLKLGIASDPNGWFKKTLGIIFIVVGIFIITGFDKKIEYSLLSNGFFDVTKIEQSLLNNTKSDDITKSTNDIATTTSTSTKPTVSTIINNIKKAFYPKAPELVSPSGYINTDGKPITIAQFKGKKVVLLDIWTYSCINCQRTLPYVKQWYEKYKDKGLEIIGLHTPEFGFEKVQSNVEKAVKDLGITYPVVMDNNYATWNAYGNSYWPRKYLINTDGEIIYDHIGEGNYTETEKAIQDALGISSDITKPKDAIDMIGGDIQSPETYFGSYRNLDQSIYEGAKWSIFPEFAELTEPGTITYNYSAKNVYMVASASNGAQIEVYVDGIKINTVDIKDEKLYTLVEGKDYGKHKLELKVSKKGLKVFTYTFG